MTLARPKILVLGDALIDQWVYQTTTRPNPEHPATSVVTPNTTVTAPGGAMNVARGIQALGADPTFLCTTPLTADAMARLRGFNIPVTGVVDLRTQARTVPLPKKTRYYVDGKLVFRQDVETIAAAPIFPLTPTSHQRLFTDLRAIVVSDYAKGAVTGETLQWLFDRLWDYPPDTPIDVVLDLKPVLLAAVAKAWLDVPRYVRRLVIRANEAEMQAGLGVSDAHRAFAALFGQDDQDTRRAVVITRGRNGATLGDGPRYEQRAEFYAATHRSRVTEREGPVLNVCGAGDVFTAVLVTTLAMGHGLQYATRNATECAAAAVRSGRQGTLCAATEVA